METKDIWKNFSKNLKRFILSKVKDEIIADDILQEIFIKIHLKKESLQKKDRLKSWLFTIANNTINDYFKKKNFNFSEISEDKTTIEQTDNNHNASDCLVPLILNLEKKYKDILLLTEIKGLKQAKAAEQLNISLPAAKSRIQRGRELLKKGFMDCCDYTLDKNGHLKGESKDIEDCKICN